jgi:uncharacterized repeat protein (TIGR01451 family)
MFKSQFSTGCLRLSAISIFALAMTTSHTALAAGTRAGTPIDNTATASFDGPDGRVELPSNTVSITVDELLDVTVDSSDPGDVATSPDADDEVLTYLVTNTGNGSEAFTLTADTARPGDDFDTALVQIVLDTNGNGVYDPGEDEIYVAGGNDPVLEPDANITVFIINNIPADAEDGQRAEVSLTAEAVTGTGAPGTVFDGQGDGGGDAVVGTTGADDDDSGFFIIQAASIALVKEATVLDPFGGTSAVPGSIITYSLIATVTGSGTLENVVISDPIPANTIYQTETITLEGASLTDADTADDAGAFDGTAISVDLGDVPGGQTRTITFQVEIDDEVTP